MKFWKKFFLPLFLFCLFFSLPGCSFNTPDKINRSFQQFTLSLFRQEAASTTINLHYTLQTPSEYGILNTPVTYGSFSADTVSAMASLENCQAVLKSFPYNMLSKENQLTFDVLNDYLQTSKKGAKYLLYEEPLNPITGIQSQLPVLLAEYQFYSVEDVETYLDLIETTPQYFASLIDFEIEKSEKGLFFSDDIAASVIKECQSFLDIGEDNYLYSTFEERLASITSLSENERRNYISQNKSVLKNYLFPAYRKLITALSELHGKGIKTAGVCNLPDGKKYYEYIVEQKTGSSRNISELKALIKQQMLTDSSALNRQLQAASILPLTSKNNTPAAFLDDLKSKLPKSFPPAPNVNTSVKYVPKPMEPYLSPAFYLIPCIDNTSENTIYINPSHTVDSLNLYTTLAHEGYPGHLYQTIYYADKKPNPLRTLLNYGGYIEGWATYAEMCSYYLAPLDKTKAILAQKNSSLILGIYAAADIGIHYDNWTLNDTISHFSKYGIKDKKTISEIYQMIVASPANYLKYYIGYVEFLELKKEIIKKTGKDFSQIEFHKAVLDVGPAPFDIVRKYVLEYFS